MSDDTATTIPYTAILERREKAVKIDLGEGDPVWFPLSKISLDEIDYTLSAPRSLIEEKQGRGAGLSAAEEFGNERIRLAAAAWKNDRSIGIDVLVSNISNPRAGSIKKRVFFPVSQIEDGTAPRWLVQKKEQELLNELAEGTIYSPDNFMIRGLIAKRKAAA